MTKLICRRTECEFNTKQGMGECTKDKVFITAFGRVVCASNFKLKEDLGEKND